MAISLNSCLEAPSGAQTPSHAVHSATSYCLWCCADEHVVLNALLCPGRSVGILSCIYAALLTGVGVVVVSQQWVILNQLPQAENL